MKELFKRLVALVMGLMMCAALLPAAALADEEAGETGETAIVEENGSSQDGTEAVIPEEGSTEEPAAPGETGTEETDPDVADTDPAVPGEDAEEPAEGDDEPEEGEEELPTEDADLLTAEQSGDCGTGVTFTLSNMELTISGEGAIDDYSEGGAPWYANRGDIETIVIGNGITAIGSYAFAGCRNVTSVTIGTAVTTIGKGAFDECAALTLVAIPEKVTTIGDGAFADCSSLSNVTGMDGVTKIGANAFASTAIAVMNLPKEIASIGTGAFKKCTKLTAIYVEAPDSDTDTEAARQYASVDGVLYDYAKETLLCYPGGKSGSFTVPEGVKEIADYAFYGAAGVTGVTLARETETIGNHAFEDSSLTGMTCPALCKLDYVGEDAFRASKLTTFQVPVNLAIICEGAFAACTSLTAFTVDSGNTDYMAVNGVLFSADGSALYAYPAGKTGAYTVTAQKDATSVAVAEKAFQGATGLTMVTLDGTVDEICASAFSGCTSLQTVTLGASVGYIGKDAFNGCKAISQLNYTATEAEWNAFTASESFGTGNTALVNAANKTFTYVESETVAEGSCGTGARWTLDDKGVLTVSGTGDMNEYTETSLVPWVDYVDQIKTVKVLTGITAIGSYCFFGCENLSSVSIADSVVRLGSFAFAGCTALTQVQLPAGLISLGNGVFRYSHVAAFTISTDNDSYMTADGVLFSKNGKMLISFPPYKAGDYTIPDGCVTIGSLAFEYNEMLDTLTIGKDVTGVYPDSFRAGNLTAYDVASGNEVFKAEDGVLYNYAGDALVSYPMGRADGDYTVSSSVTQINTYAFYGAENLVTVRLPHTVTSIGSYAFTYCTGINKAVFEGSAAQWSTLYASIETGNEAIINHIMVHDGHQFEEEVTTPATCTEAGETTYTCTICGYSYADDTKPAATGHNYVTVKGRAATYWSEGKTEGVKCSLCGDVKTEQEVIAKLVPNAPTVTYKAASSATVKWTKVADAKGYYIYRKEADKPDSAYALVKTITKGTTVSVADTGLTAGHAYDYYYEAYTVIDGVTYTTEASGETCYKASLAKPVITVKKVDATHIRISWKAITGAEGYVVYMNDGSGLVANTITDPEVLAYEVEVAPTGTYSFYVIAYSEVSGVYVQSAASATKKLRLTMAKPALTAKKTSATTIHLSWKAVAGADEYEVLNVLTGVTDTVSGLSLDVTVLPGSSYKYQVRAISYAGGKTTVSAYSAARTVKMAFAAPSVRLVKEDAQTITLSWKAIAGATAYEIYESDAKAGEYTLKDIVTDITVSYPQMPGATHYYKVRAVCTINSRTVYSNYSSIRYIKLTIGTPVTTVKRTDIDEVTITWKEIDGADGYKVFMSDTKNGEYVEIYDGMYPEYTESLLEPGLHYFKVVAYVTDGTDTVYSAYSAIKYVRTY